MRKFLCCRDNFAEKQAWQKYCWVNIEMPTEEDTLYLTRDLKIPSAFLSDIRDVDERPRIETEDGWTLMILRIPDRDEGNDIPFGNYHESRLFRDDLSPCNGYAARFYPVYAA